MRQGAVHAVEDESTDQLMSDDGRRILKTLKKNVKNRWETSTTYPRTFPPRRRRRLSAMALQGPPRHAEEALGGHEEQATSQCLV